MMTNDTHTAARGGNLLQGALRRLARDKQGNVFMIMGFALLPITMAAGMTVDYARAGRVKTKLDAVADAAVLSAVTEASKAANDKAVCERAAALFDAQAKLIPDIQYARASSLTITVGSPSIPSNAVYNGETNSCSAPASGNPASNSANRVVSLTYTVQSTNFFGKVLNRDTLPVAGRAGSESATAPDIDFYVALDTSPSMALPVTTTGINDLVNATAIYSGAQNTTAYQATYTATQKGCAFACHSNKIETYIGSGKSLGEYIQDNAKYAIVKDGSAGTGTFGTNSRDTTKQNPIVWVDTTHSAFVYQNGKRDCLGATCTADLKVYNADGTFVDTYWYARNKSITLRIDEMRRATSDLVTTALTQAASNGATYRAAIYAFDHSVNFRTIKSLTKIAEKNPSSTTLAAGTAFQATAASSIDAATVNDKGGNGCPLTGCTGSNTYLFTSFKSLFDGMLGTGVLPATSGTGTRVGPDTPQAILFIVTDGMSDEQASAVGGDWSLGSDRTRGQLTGLLPNPAASTHLNKCEAIKNRGIRIAILYTEYTASSIASDEATQKAWVTGRIPSVEPRLIDCASPGLMLKVSTDGDISAALTALFLKATTAARLVK